MLLLSSLFPLLLLKTVSVESFLDFGRRSTAVLCLSLWSLSSGLASFLRDQMKALGVLVLRQSMPPDSHLSNNATFLWHWDQNRDKNHRMKTELEDPSPKFFGHIHAENMVCNRLLVPGWTSWGNLSECALALVGAGTWTPLWEKGQCVSPC